MLIMIYILYINWFITSYNISYILSNTPMLPSDNWSWCCFVIHSSVFCIFCFTLILIPLVYLVLIDLVFLVCFWTYSGYDSVLNFNSFDICILLPVLFYDSSCICWILSSDQCSYLTLLSFILIFLCFKIWVLNSLVLITAIIRTSCYKSCVIYAGIHVHHVLHALTKNPTKFRMLLVTYCTRPLRGRGVGVFEVAVYNVRQCFYGCCQFQ